MEVSFDKVANVLYLQFSREQVKDTEEISEEIIVDYGESKFIIGIEILNFIQRKKNLNELIRMSAEEIVSTLVKLD